MTSYFDPLPSRPTNWDEVFAITGKRADVEIALIEQGRLDWEYHFSSKDLRPCGRKGCHQMHAWGWLVSLPGGGHTNIGHCCADTHANKTLWNARTREYDQRINKLARDQAVEHARDTAQQVFHYLEESKALHAARSLYESFMSVAPSTLKNELSVRAERGNVVIQHEHYLSKAERDLRRSQLEGNRPEGAPPIWVAPTEMRDIGSLSGLRAFKGTHSPREMCIRLERAAAAVLRRQPDNDDVAGRKALDEDRVVLESRRRELAAVVDAIEAFFAPSNLAMLSRLPLLKRLGIRGITVTNGNVTLEDREQTLRSA